MRRLRAAGGPDLAFEPPAGRLCISAQGLSISILEIAVQIRKLKLLELADVPVTHLPSFLLGLWVEFLRTTCVGREHSAFSLEQPQHSSTGKHLFGAWGLL